MSKKSLYALMNKQLQGLVSATPYPISRLSNASALLAESLEDINWAGFYLMRDGKLILGPFQGKVACAEIQVGRGVCGTAVERDEVVRVEDVHQFPGHIACDCDSNSEIVLPIHRDDEIAAVLDIDSPLFGRFDAEDEDGLSQFVRILEEGKQAADEKFE